MNQTVIQEELRELIKQDPVKVLELCKECINNKFFHENKKETTIDITPTVPKYMSVKKWVSTFGYIPEGGVRHLIFSNPIFNQRVVRRLGKKLLLDVQAFELWISEQHEYTTQ